MVPVDGYRHVPATELRENGGYAFGVAAFAMGETATQALLIENADSHRMGVQVEFNNWPEP